MKISQTDLTLIEERHHIPVIQSDYPEIAYAADKKRSTIWLIDRLTGAQIEISAENVYPFAYELMDVADLYISQRNLFRKGA